MGDNKGVHAIATLEFDAVRDLIGGYLRSPLGRRALADLSPIADRAAILDSLADLREAVAYLRAASSPQSRTPRPRFEIETDPSPIAARLRIEGASLDAPEIYV